MAQGIPQVSMCKHMVVKECTMHDIASSVMKDGLGIALHA